ncbi:MAG: GvpL/GvpF family gas vesicle protein [Chloroflexi bacterium]|nr:GvpL/GvpF family gas vesicle protein [Chloroflexota bacterium]
MTQPGKYIYCIIRCPEPRAFADVAPLAEGGGVVHAVPHDGLAAVVCDSLAADYESTRANMLAHQRVLERVMREFTLLPVRFGTVASPPSPEGAVRRLLGKRDQEFGGLLAEIEGKAELGLKALWRNEKAVFEEIVAENEAIRRLRDAIQRQSAQATHFDRIRLGELVSKALAQKKAREAAGIMARLRALACRSVENECPLDRMVLNAAFLVEKAREPEFDRAVNSLSTELDGRLSFKYVGPVPPYNFVNITVSWQEL